MIIISNHLKHSRLINLSTMYLPIWLHINKNTKFIYNLQFIYIDCLITVDYMILRSIYCIVSYKL